MYALNLLLLAGGLLILATLVAGVVSARLGLSFLLVFLAAGMLVGVDGPGGVRFDNTVLTAWVGNAALAVILIEGGVSTRMSIVRAGFRPALLLATLGVLLTAAIVGAMAMWVMRVDWRHGLLLGAMVASTDAAAVFSVLRHAGLRLGERVSASLEMESGLNDPMAVFLTLALIATIKAEAGTLEAAELLLRQVGFGAAVGLAGGWGMAWLLRKLTLAAGHGGLVSLMILSAGLAVFAGAGLLEGSGFLAVYLYGVRLRALAENAALAASSALDGFAWAAQAGMFLLLGLLVSPHQMLEAAWPTLAIVGTLMFVARPLAVWLCLAPLRFSRRQRLFVGWVGLRGAVPIVLALFPLMEQVPGSYRFFNVAFAAVLASLLLQGTTLGWAARRLGVVEPPASPHVPPSAPVRRLIVDASQPIGEVFHFCRLPLPPHPGPTLGDWLGATLAAPVQHGDGLEWQGARFGVAGLTGGRIARIDVELRGAVR